MNVSSIANSLVDNGTGVPAHETSRVAGSSTKIAHRQDRRPLRIASPGERTQAREELGKRKRLHQVVIRAAVETGNAVIDGVPSGQHQHRRPDAGCAHAPADLEAVDVRQHHVQHDRVVLVRLRHPHSDVAAVGDVGRKPLVDEAAPDEARHPQLVFDDEHAHDRIFADVDERQMTAG